MAKALNIIGNILLGLACFIIVIAYILVAINQGMDKLFDMLSPFNIFNWIAVILALLPGIVLKVIASKIKTGKRAD